MQIAGDEHDGLAVGGQLFGGGRLQASPWASWRVMFVYFSNSRRLASWEITAMNRSLPMVVLPNVKVFKRGDSLAQQFEISLDLVVVGQIAVAARFESQELFGCLQRPGQGGQGEAGSRLEKVLFSLRLLQKRIIIPWRKQFANNIAIGRAVDKKPAPIYNILSMSRSGGIGRRIRLKI